ncbi:hypothetical protein OOK27_09650 [Streptomyces canus]|uniref:hypothetical protein n=1 Tax=Streptomyces canus TaxID=58343 RepID=UPI0022530251|nr:hypothetical protein [Streptomyces canus]MCX5254440.1 hypothetical protein [Streptomyces canus]
MGRRLKKASLDADGRALAMVEPDVVRPACPSGHVERPDDGGPFVHDGRDRERPPSLHDPEGGVPVAVTALTN